jgi:hypothetical protein
LNLALNGNGIPDKDKTADQSNMPTTRSRSRNLKLEKTGAEWNYHEFQTIAIFAGLIVVW